MRITGFENVTQEDIAYETSVTTVCGCWKQKHNTIALAKRVLAEGVPGDFAECGVCAGTQPALMAYVLSRYGGAGRRVHLFDSFELGFSKERVHVADDLVGYVPAAPEPAGETMTSVEQVKANMVRWQVDRSRLVYHEGWLEESLPRLAAAGALPEKLALLRLDIDFYSPTKAAFEYLYDRVSPGGFIISDDWGMYDLDHPNPNGCRMAALNFFANRRLRPPIVTHVSDGTVWWRKE